MPDGPDRVDPKQYKPTTDNDDIPIRHALPSPEVQSEVRLPFAMQGYSLAVVSPADISTGNLVKFLPWDMFAFRNMHPLVKCSFPDMIERGGHYRSFRWCFGIPLSWAGTYRLGTQYPSTLTSFFFSTIRDTSAM